MCVQVPSTLFSSMCAVMLHLLSQGFVWGAQVFGKRYHQQMPSDRSGLKSADAAYVLAFSVIMLNTDLHNTQVKGHTQSTQNNQKPTHSNALCICVKVVPIGALFCQSMAVGIDACCCHRQLVGVEAKTAFTFAYSNWSITSLLLPLAYRGLTIGFGCG